MTTSTDLTMADVRAELAQVRVVGAGGGPAPDRPPPGAAAAPATAASASVVLGPGIYRVASDLTVHSPAVLHPGAVVKPDSGATVVFAGGLEAPLEQVFDHSGGGIVAPAGVDFYHPAWWGPIGTEDDSATWIAMAAAISASAIVVNTIPMGQRIMAPRGLNRLIGVSLQSCELYADRGVVAFAPPATAVEGVMLTLNGYVTVHGGYFYTSNPGQAVCLIDVQGYRTQVESPYIVPSAASSIGLRLGSGPSITPVVTNARIHGGTSATGSIGLYSCTPDAELTNVWIAGCDVGAHFQVGGALVNTLHVWGCNTGMEGSLDGCMITNLYLDSNLGWGADVPGTDRCVITNLSVWNNGTGVVGTGGFRVQKIGATSCRGLQIAQATFDDNVGTDLFLDGAEDVSLDQVLFTSRTVSSGRGGPVTDTGLVVTAACTNVRANIQGHAGHVTTTLVDDRSNAAGIGLGTISKVLLADSTAPSTVFTVKVGSGERWLVEGVLVVDGDPTEDFKARLQGTSCPQVSGWFACQWPALSTTSFSAVWANPAAVVDVTSAAGLYSSTGLVAVGTRQAIPFHGYVDTGAGAAAGAVMVLTWAKVADNGLVMTVHAGSWLRASRIG
jgi:hypothetical protein